MRHPHSAWPFPTHTQKKSQLEHILLRPDTYIGSTEKQQQQLWVHDGDRMVLQNTNFVPGLYKIFDEILVNAADNKVRDPTMDTVRVSIDEVRGCACVCVSPYLFVCLLLEGSSLSVFLRLPSSAGQTQAQYSWCEAKHRPHTHTHAAAPTGQLLHHHLEQWTWRACGDPQGGEGVRA